MNNQLKTRLRAARLIRDVLSQSRQNPASFRLPERHWSDCLRTLSRIKQATERGWLLAAAQLRRELLRELDSCAANLHELSRELQGAGTAQSLPSVGDTYRDIAALDAEFEDVEIDLQAGALCVTTPAVELESVYLGPFQICLDWNQLGQSSPYRIVALEPNHAASNEEVTHPHVSAETLCEGDGRRAIRGALDEGRLSDFFLLVWRLLDTYAPGRAYVELSEWYGSPCQECGTSVDEDDRCYCSQCDDLICVNCISPCPHCSRDFCGGCISTCRGCGGNTCARCCQPCISCQKMFCPDCLDEGVCGACREQQEEQEEASETPDCHEEKTHQDETH